MNEKEKFKVTKKDIKVMVYQFVAAVLMFFSIMLYKIGELNSKLPQYGILLVGLMIVVVRMKK